MYLCIGGDGKGWMKSEKLGMESVESVKFKILLLSNFLYEGYGKCCLAILFYF